MSQPLTDEDLVLFEQDAKTRKAEKEPRGYGPAMQVLRLVAEVRRLRSDEWLGKAAKEISADLIEGPEDLGQHWTPEILAILRKHRDGKA